MIKFVPKYIYFWVFPQSFVVFPEYFIVICFIYILIVFVLVNYNIYGLLVQRALSECVSVILIMVCYLIANDMKIGINFLTFNDSIINDYLAFFTKFLVCFFSAIYFFIIADYLKEQKLIAFEYLLVIFAILGLMFLCNSNDLLTAYLAIELSSFGFYILASFKKVSNYSVESGIKYFVTGAISSSFFLLGSSFIYGFLGSIKFKDIFILFGSSNFDYLPCEAMVINNESENFACSITFFLQTLIQTDYEFFNFNFLELGLILILFSLFIKLALVPFHLWSLDVYEGSPTSSTFFFTVITKLSIFVLLIRICYLCFFELNEYWRFYSLWTGLLSIFIGSFGGLKQRKLKTLLAYSSISHMGYSLIAFSAANCLGIQILFIYLVIYMLSGLCVWSIFLFTRLKYKNFDKYNKELNDLVLLRKSNSGLAFALALTMFSIAGIPPLVGFLAKMGVFLSIMDLVGNYDQPWPFFTTFEINIAWVSFVKIALISILFSVVSTFYYIRIIKVLYFETLLIGKLYYSINNKKTIMFSILIFSLIFLFVNPGVLYLLTTKVILSLELFNSDMLSVFYYYSSILYKY
uniref:NADH dehydrogenase subunit 2 n=1 Tax=Amicula sp. isolate GU52X-4 cfCalB7 TaxID=3003489 RepID=A0A9E8YZJ7_9STRA|nr:NADH dehydrogenase subunit 2 [Amicula sp. isolate GU52X-4 cfCalB7]